MARRSTRDMILDVAARLFATTGLRQTTIEAIATEAGRGRRTVYMYFANKAEIYEAVVQREIRSIIKPLHDVVSSGDDFETILDSMEIPVVFINIPSPLPLSTTLVSPVTISTPAALAALLID